jgi:hypothetical protein
MALLLLAVVRLGLSRPPQADRPAMQTGWVRLSSSEDGLTTVITVAGRQPTPDGVNVIDRAYRLQHLQPEPLTYEGPASVMHRANQLVVAVDPAHGWRFPVAGKPVIAESAPTQYLEIPVRGLSQHWGPSIRRSHDEVVPMLLTGVCAAAAGGTGTCDPCATGGSGSDGCDIDCGDTSCSTECGGGTHACCNCPGSCVCCPDRQSSAPVKK